ncbi:protein translocase subunit SecF [Streptomyces aidingensis]|uniref:Protein-export membrane protein SecF n=1 Tax=Streptomyces aidingensis TaxID=910347 RepID=A0A1I1RT94_9ACTN|nr:protein translocase subunit SecF [Streptomyces aidingensis]SFD37554.1 preprotein translocase subunit SecF [Streptomyces aidingensis]
MSRFGTLGAKLYRGEVSYDFVGRRKFWYAITVLLVIVSLTGLGVRGLFMGVDFEGGAVFTTPSDTSISQADARKVVGDTVGRDARVQELGSGSVRVQVTELSTEQSAEVRAALAEEAGVEAEDVNAELVGPSWGEQMTDKALRGVIIFLALVTLYLAIAFEWRMALGALVALAHDLVITIGVYAFVGFEVTPGTVVGLLTILGYSLYDTVVVFDKVKEKTASVTKQTRFTYAELANQGINATAVRSVNTSIVALLPVGGLLFIGTGLLGGGMLKDIALSLFIGLAAGTFSSIFIATPVVVDFRLRDPEIRAHDRRIMAKRAERAERGEEGETTNLNAPSAVQLAVSRPGAPADETLPTDEDGFVVVQRRQPVSRSRGRGRPSGKRR